MKISHLISLFVLCSPFCTAFTNIQQQNQQYASLASQPIYSGFLNSITLVQQDSGYVFNMTQNGDYIQPATASSTQNFSASISLSSSLTVINSASLSGVSALSDTSDESSLSYLPYLDVYTNNAISLDVYLGVWQVTNCSFTFDEATSSLPSSLQPQADAYIGLGTSNTFSASYNQTTKLGLPIFSVFIGESTAELIFGTDMTKAASQTPIATFSPIMGPLGYMIGWSTLTNPTAQLEALSSGTPLSYLQLNPTDWTFEVNSLQVNQSTFDLAGVTAAFDINLNGILMPPAIYSEITSYLCSTYCSSCGTTQDDRSLTTCEISSPSLLPSLVISMNNVQDDQDASESSDSLSFTNNASIPISPEGYTFSETIDGQNYTVFNFISDTSNGGYLIIGSQAMSLFYTVFTSSSESTEDGLSSVSCYTITLYQANQDSENTDDSDATSIISQAYTIVGDMESSDSEMQDSKSSELSDSDGNLFANLSNVQNLTAAVQQNYQKVLQLQQMVTKVNQASSTSSGFVSILNDINQGINVVEPFLDTLGIFTGFGPAVSIVGSFLSIFGIGGGSDISGQLNELSQEIAVLSEQVDDLAHEISAAAEDITQMLNVISDDIVQVYTKISDLQGQQTAYFNTIMNDEQADVCFAQLSVYESAIVGGMQALQALANITNSSQIDGFKTNFQDTCAFCSIALEGLLNVFDPQSEESGCDIISILTAGNATYHRNWQLSIAGSGGHIISLINMGLTVVSALESLQSNSSDAWMVVESTYNASYQQAVQSLQSAVVGCYETYYQDAQWNVFNYTQEFPETATIGEITQLLSLLYPWKGWIVLSLSIVSDQTVVASFSDFDISDGVGFVTIDNNFAVMSTSQNFTVQLQTDGLITIQSFELQNPIGLINNGTQWLWQSVLPGCFSDPSGSLETFCNSLSFITTSTVVPSDSSDQMLSIPSTPGILNGGQFGTNILDSAGAVYSWSDFSDGELQGADGVTAYVGTFSMGAGVAFYWPNA